jgi:hypothetical protein
MQKEISDWPLKIVLEALENNRVQYILIGGQAVVAYGASQFTRDVDFWVNPTIKNINTLKKALDSIGSKLRFLPPLEPEYLRKGHGVHFKFNHKGREFLIDILGKPPRVSGFVAAYRDSRRIKWHGLDVPVLDIPRLVMTKKTNREKDYLVIENLTESVYKTAVGNPGLRSSAVFWLLQESRKPEHLIAMTKKWKGAGTLALKSGRPAAVAAAKGKKAHEIQKALDEEKEALKKANVEYWRPFIADLRKMRRKKRS